MRAIIIIFGALGVFAFFWGILFAMHGGQQEAMIALFIALKLCLVSIGGNYIMGDHNNVP